MPQKRRAEMGYFLQMQLCIGFGSWDPKANCSVTGGARTGRGEERWKQEENKAQEDLAWADKEVRTRSWVGGGREVAWELQKQSTCHGGRSETSFSSNEGEGRAGWLRRGWEAQGEGGKTEGRSGRNERVEDQACRREREGSSLPSRAWRFSDLAIFVSTCNYSFPQATGACANAKFLYLQKNYIGVSMIP